MPKTFICYTETIKTEIQKKNDSKTLIKFPVLEGMSYNHYNKREETFVVLPFYYNYYLK